MEFEQTPRAAPLHRPLIAAEPDIDPHRLVAVCCQHAGDEPLSVSLLIPVEDDARPWSESAARAERLLRDVDVLLGAAGIDLEEVVITDEARMEVAAALLLVALLAAYVATRFVALAPRTHPEAIDLLGVTTKLIEAGGLVLALRLLGTRAGGAALGIPPSTPMPRRAA